MKADMDMNMNDSHDIYVFATIVILVIVLAAAFLALYKPYPPPPEYIHNCIAPVYPPEQAELGMARCAATETAAAQPPAWWQFWGH